VDSLDPATIETYRRDGVVLLRGVLDDEWLARLAEGVEHNRAHPSPWAHWYTDEHDAVGFWSDYVTWPEVDAYRQVAFESGLAEIAGELMASSTVRFFHEHVLVKEPGAVERTPWHHDQPYYCVDGDQNVSFWVALDPVPAEAGMRFLAGSHRWGRRFVPRRFVDHEPYADPPDGFELVPDLDAELASHRVLAFEIEPGDVLAFHFRTLHDAAANHLTSRRRAVSLRWLGDDARFATRPWPVSPPYEPDGLVPGGPLDGDPRFPLVVD
jgi:ectoine hydroxylase-related dioxygenase (phytanoyl-CoA dioxygenase family)